MFYDYFELQPYARKNDKLTKVINKKYPSLVQWFKNKYNLAVNDPKFVNATMLDIYEDYALYILEHDEKENLDVSEKETHMLALMENGQITWKEYEDFVKKEYGIFNG